MLHATAIRSHSAKAAALLALALSGFAQAGPIVNGGFESGNASGWFGSAYGGVVNASAFPAPPSRAARDF